jgi:hypothetical protein
MLGVDRQDVEVLAEWLRDDGCPEDRLAIVVRAILDPNHERSVPEFWTGAEILNDDDRFTVRRQPPGWSRER